jgi:hypothetical protein
MSGSRYVEEHTTGLSKIKAVRHRLIVALDDCNLPSRLAAVCQKVGARLKGSGNYSRRSITAPLSL